MAKIYRVSDRIPIKVDGLVFKISPLTFNQKADIQSKLLSQNPMSIMEAARLSLKFAIKDVSGIENQDGSKYELDTDDTGLTDECVDDLLNMDQSDKLTLVCTSLLNGIPKEFIDPETGKKIEGITIQRGSSAKKK